MGGGLGEVVDDVREINHHNTEESVTKIKKNPAAQSSLARPLVDLYSCQRKGLKNQRQKSRTYCQNADEAHEGRGMLLFDSKWSETGRTTWEGESDLSSFNKTVEQMAETNKKIRERLESLKITESISSLSYQISDLTCLFIVPDETL